jgi:hypothetical protein
VTSLLEFAAKTPSWPLAVTPVNGTLKFAISVPVWPVAP